MNKPGYPAAMVMVLRFSLAMSVLLSAPDVLSQASSSSSTNLASGPTTRKAFLGLGLVNQGDDVSRPIASLEVVTKTYFGTLNYFGRSFGPVKEQQAFVGGGWVSSVHQDWPFTIRYGFTILREATSVKGLDGAWESEAVYVPGVVAGFSFDHSIQSFAVGASWDSYIFPAGIVGGILLANARRQVLNIKVGVHL